MLAKLNDMARAFAKEFNEVHRGGAGLPPENETGINFFEPYEVDADGNFDYDTLTAGNIGVRDEIIKTLAN